VKKYTRSFVPFGGFSLNPAGESSTTVFYITLFEIPRVFKITGPVLKRVLDARAIGIFKLRKFALLHRTEENITEWKKFLEAHKMPPKLQK
jgi:hypothetical protein